MVHGKDYNTLGIIVHQYSVFFKRNIPVIKFGKCKISASVDILQVTFGYLSKYIGRIISTLLSMVHVFSQFSDF